MGFRMTRRCTMAIAVAGNDPLPRSSHSLKMDGTDQSARPNDVCSWGETGSDRRNVKSTRLTLSRPHLPGSRRVPTNERSRAPTSLSPGDALLAILRAVVARLWRAGE